MASPPPLENPNPPTHDPDIPDEEDPDQDDPEEITPFSSPSPMASYFRRGPRRKKIGKRRVFQEIAWKRKLSSLTNSLNPVPFVPDVPLDLVSHEALLRRVGLWDFVQLEFDTSLRADLIVQLVATFNRDTRVSYVNGVRIKVSRADLGRALRLPRKDKVGGGGECSGEVKGSKEDVWFMEKLVSNWFLLHDNMWMMPAEVLNVMGSVKEGSFERVDWAGLIWFMVEKELLGKSTDFGNCYYASHLQCLIKHQRRELFEGGVVNMELDVEEDEEARVCEEVSGDGDMEECCIGLSLGGLNDVVNDEDSNDIMVEDNVQSDAYSGKLLESVAKDNGKMEISVEDNVAKHDVKDGREVKKLEPVTTTSTDGFVLGRCNQIGLVCVDFEEDREHEKHFEGEEEINEIDEGQEEDDDEEEEEEDDEEEEDGDDYDDDDYEEEEEGEEEGDGEELGEDDFSIRARGQDFECVASENLVSEMEAVQHPFTSELQMHNNVSGQFLMSNVEAQRTPGNSSVFGNCYGNKREIGHLENDYPHSSLVGGNKRMRNDGPWETKISSDMDIYMDQMQHLMEKCKMMYNTKEQACQEMEVNQQFYLGELQRRDNVIQHLKEDAQRKQLENRKLERELYMMGDLLDGYRKALKGTQKAFADYRAKCPLPLEPIYVDTGIGGLVLTKAEVEKQRLKREEEEKLTLLFLKKKILDFEAGFASNFGSCNNFVDLLSDKLSGLEKKANLLKEKFARRVATDMLESAPNSEGCMTIDKLESAPNTEGCMTIDIPKSAPNTEGCMTIDKPESAPNTEGCMTIDIPKSAPNTEGCMTIDKPESAPFTEGFMTIDIPKSAPNTEGCMTTDIPESAPKAEGCMTTDIPESAPKAEGCITIDIPESAPNTDGCMTTEMPESAPNLEGCIP